MALIDLADARMLPIAPAGVHPPGEQQLDELEPGTRVDVRRKLDDKWATGFEFLAATPDGYCLRRLSDGAVLPVLFPAGDVRRAKKKNTWWY